MIGGAPDRTPTLHAEADDGALIAYRRYGGAGADAAGAVAAAAGPQLPPVLLVHGFATDARVTWQGTGWVKALVDAGRDVITVDLRGHGESDTPIEADAYRAAVLGADLVAVLDSVGVPVVDVVAYSMGCRVATAFATLAPDRLRRLVLGGAGPREHFAAWRLDEVRALLLDGVPSSDPVVEQVLKPALDAGADPEVLLAVVSGFAGAPLEVPGGVPVLFVAGELDPVPAGVAELARDHGAELVTVPGRDHVSTLTSRVFKDAAIGFLGS
ncbi:alpha/beta hydrolase [Agromyces endophyticus]|uniref:alpha/beta fold hydrolase n=1 Tax=Agromyces sp. H17E-10 TaxID=2932244 RepID=UPI001FD3E327|nr:alpha/beta fold hydrolase [Agromyces sp. H17E-10]UOQ89940.1 alpha/beta hydrolase [Agromyces sp. H17E-10]